jgi:hypothetical protein
MPLPTLDELVQDPNRVEGLPVEVLTALLARCGAAQGIVSAELIVSAALRSNGGRGLKPEIATDDRMLTVEEASNVARQPRRWFYRNAGRYPWIKRVSRKKILVSEKGLRRFLASTT